MTAAIVGGAALVTFALLMSCALAKFFWWLGGRLAAHNPPARRSHPTAAPGPEPVPGPTVPPSHTPPGPGRQAPAPAGPHGDLDYTLKVWKCGRIRMYDNTGQVRGYRDCVKHIDWDHVIADLIDEEQP